MTDTPDVVDWGVAVRVGRSIAGNGPATTPSYRAEVRRDFAELTTLSDGLVREFTGLNPTERAPDPIVLDRAGWMRANAEAFQHLLGPLSEKVANTVTLGGAARRMTGAALGVQMGILLGYLSKKVLGQYDLVLATEGAGKVYFVGPNIVEAERRMNLAPRDFRLWITLHEITHRTQFAGVPWLRDRVQTLVARSLAGLDLDPARVKAIVARGRELLLRGPSAWKTANVMDLLLSDEQRGLLGEMQALMCVVEGHGTFVMNRIGRREIPGFAEMRHAVDARKSSTRGAERAFQRAIGMDMKIEQYALGERFLEAVAEQAGLGAVNDVWGNGGENMPTLAEMADPASWLARVRP